MSSKKKRGRPRKYPNSAARQKAYHERKKKKIAEMEKKLRELEKKLKEEQK
ncbi:MAG TPA: hypothetical protein VMX55_12800 [candidate division Zixibacteria bacterium]|nr:hypothetical protein [candidate division Zixibacteria bacterium]